MDHLQLTVGVPLTEDEKHALCMEFGYREDGPAAEQPKEPMPTKHVVKIDAGASPQKMVRNKSGKARGLQRRVGDGDRPTNGIDVEFNKTPTGSTPTATTGSASPTRPAQPEAQRQTPENTEVRRALQFADELITEGEMRRLQGGRSAAMGPPLRPPPEETEAGQPEWLRVMKGMIDNQGDRMEGMFRGVDNRMSSIEEVLVSSTARTQQRIRYLEGFMRYELVRNNEKQDQKFGEELRRVELKMENMATTPDNNLRGIEGRLMKLEEGTKLQKRQSDAEKTAGETASG